MHKDSKKALRLALDGGLLVETRTKHYLITKPTGEKVAILPLGSKSNPRNERAARSQIRRAIAELEDL